MASYNNQRILPIILVIVIIIIAVAALVSLARAIFFSGGSGDAADEDITRSALLSTDVDRSVTMTVRGPIVADEEFHSYSVRISPSTRVITAYSGYLDAVVDRQSYPNSTAAYEQFVYALDKAQMSEGDQFEGEANDVRGVCATGRVYEFSTLYGSETIEMLWTSTCSGSPGSLRASADQLRTLFLAQIPDARDVTRQIGL